MLLIGSRALKLRAPDLLQHEPVDFDFIATKEEAYKWLQEKNLQITEETNDKIISNSNPPPLEFELADNKSSSKLLIDMVEKDNQTIDTSFGKVPNLHLLFLLKASHKYLKNSPHFWKTAIDYHRMKSIGLTILPEYQELFKLREKETYTYSHPKLNVKKDEFFVGDGVKYVYDHDDIHEAVKHLDKPAYKYYLKDGQEVQSDRNKFFACDESVRLFGVLEETYVLALERSQIPFGDKITPKQSFIFALSKVCSSITSGWFREYGYENIFTVLKMYDENYLNKFNEAVKAGKVSKL